MVAEMDKDGSGHVTFDEWRDFLLVRTVLLARKRLLSLSSLSFYRGLALCRMCIHIGSPSPVLD